MAENNIVLPGEEIGTEEEYSAGVGTFVQDSHVVSSITGKLDNSNRTLSVVRKSSLTVLEPGTVVIGLVDNIAEPVALVIVEPEDNERSRFATSSAYCILHASYVKRGYVKNIRDEIRIGDIIRAKVVAFKNGEHHISCEDDDCGVIKAFCSSCRHALDKKPAGLECPNCGRRENRKLSSTYRNSF
jgi:exosome complex component CSL4